VGCVAASQGAARGTEGGLGGARRRDPPMAGLLKQASYAISGFSDEADIHLIVTCSVKDATAHRIRWFQNI